MIEKENWRMTDLSQNLHGIIVPLVTPFVADGRVDEKSLRDLANHVVDGGVNGIFVMGTTGEFQYLSFEQQRLAIGTVADEVGDRTLVVAGVTGKSVEETIRNVIVIGNLLTPPDALVVAPLCYHSNRNLPQHMERLSRLSNLPVLLYNNLGIVTRRWKHKNMLPEIVGRMASLSNIVGIKDSSGNPGYFAKVLKSKSPVFHVFQGEEKSILPALQLGAAGAVPSMGNILPKLCAGLYDAFTKENTKQAEAYQRSINQINAIYPDGSSIPLILKLYLKRQGIIANPISNSLYKGDTKQIISLLESEIGELEQKGALPV
jgi:4-hydroxy-tetrahydrodipicolinate synthase